MIKSDVNDTNARIALYGGVFDPVHTGHLSVARAALKEASLDAVIFIPAARSPHKKEGPIADDEARVSMLEAAISEESRFRIDCLEMERGGVSFSVDTASHYSRSFPGAKLYWILGADQWAQLPRWHRIEAFVELVDFLVLARPGYQAVPPDIPGINYQIVPASLQTESSSEIRRRLKHRLSIKGFVDPVVEAFILSHNLYE